MAHRPCDLCGDDVEGWEEGYSLCEFCGCDEFSPDDANGVSTACFLEEEHDGPCKFTPDELVTDEEVAETLASIGRAANIAPNELGMLTY